MNELMISVNKRADRKARYQAETELFSAASKAYEEKWSVKPTPIKKVPKRSYAPINCLLLGLIFLQLGLLF